MICPTCKTHIPDGSLRCPACHAPVAVTVAMPALQGRWCPACGGGLSWEDEVCPHCGMPLERPWERADVSGPEADGAGRGAEQTDADAAPEGETQALPRIESAIPAEDDPTSKVRTSDEMPRAGRLLLAGTLAVALVGGITLAITHPWNPDQYSIRATTEADTSMAGFPGTVETLSGQDGNEYAGTEPKSADDATLEALGEAHERLGRLAQRADESESDFRTAVTGGDLKTREQGKRTADALAIDVSNLIAEVEGIDVTSGTYAGAREDLVTLGNWLRNRVEVLQAAWAAAAGQDGTKATAQELLAYLQGEPGKGGTQSYKTLFDEHFEAMRPERASR